MLCIAAAGKVASIAVTAFTLSWIHSVEHFEWQESWHLSGDRLQLVEARVEGPGAGVAIPEGARKTDRGWVYGSDLPPLRRLVLAASGMTPSGWTLCTEVGCMQLGVQAGAPIEVWAAPTCPQAVPDP